MSRGTKNETETEPRYASSPCSMPELDTVDAGCAATGLGHSRDVAQWRKEQRDIQLKHRRALPGELRRSHSTAIARHVLNAIDTAQGMTVSLYWPIRSEPDLRELADEIIRRGGDCALPVVVERDHPLEFHAWRPGDRLMRGIWNIPVPSDAERVVPDIVIAPVVAFDRDRYRLGYGGGYFDRTLSAMSGERRVLGVGYAFAEIETIHPQPHDIPMDAIVTERGVYEPA